MPIYVYKCTKCGVEREVTHSIKEDPQIFCYEDNCHYVPMARKPCPTAFLLKGKGWFNKGGY